MELPYHLVDVFTSTPLEGNALAVFPNASMLDPVAMQRIAREMNLSETTFIFPAERVDDAIRVRIFTPSYEMEFAGHPTLGTAYVMRRVDIVPKEAASFALAENVGRVPVEVDGDGRFWLTTPPIRVEDTFDPDACARALSLERADLLDIPCELLTAGNPTIFIPLRDAATVDRAAIDSVAFYGLVARRDTPTCVFPFTPTAEGAYSRMFSPELGIVEDPATGSATGPLAAYMMRHGLVASADGTRFISEQGTKMGRRSLLHVRVRGEQGASGIDVGGDVTYVGAGTLYL